MSIELCIWMLFPSKARFTTGLWVSPKEPHADCSPSNPQKAPPPVTTYIGPSDYIAPSGDYTAFRLSKFLLAAECWAGYGDFLLFLDYAIDLAKQVRLC